MSQRPPVRRLWFPALVVGVAGVAAGVLFSRDMERGQRLGTIVFMVIPATLLLLVAWLLFLSGMRWYVRVGIFLVLAAAAAAIKVDFTGDMMPIVYFRWSDPYAEKLEAHRARQGKAESAAQPFPTPSADDCAEYRNRSRDGVVSAGRLNFDWAARPPRELWRQPCGGGYAGISVVGPFAVTIEQRRGDEAVVCYDVDTGKERWVYRYSAKFTESLGGDGPRATPTIADGMVYALGALGHLACLDGATGEQKWSADILGADNKNIAWGMSGSPLVFDDLVVVNPGAQTEAARGRAVVAYERTTGRPRWQTGTRRAGYSSPMLAVLAGVRQIVLFDGEAVAGYDPMTGRELWSHPWETSYDINVAQPLVLDGDRVFVSSGYSVGCAMLSVTKRGNVWTAEELWRNTNLRCKFTSPVLHNGFIYGMDEGRITCLDARTGQRKWKGDLFGNGQLLLAGDSLIVGDEAGKLVLVKASPDEYSIAGRVQGALPGIKNWNHLTVARGRAYLRNHFEMVCYDLAAAE